MLSADKLKAYYRAAAGQMNQDCRARPLPWHFLMPYTKVKLQLLSLGQPQCDKNLAFSNIPE